jgi:glycosyltransferase involved in cell wall biosynthesis
MLLSVDAHTIGCHLTGNEVYIRNLLNEFAGLDSSANFLVYLSKPHVDLYVPRQFTRVRVSGNPWVRLGLEIPLSLHRQRPDVLHVQYTGPMSCPVPLVVTVHDVSFLENPHYFTRFRARQLKLTVERTISRAVRILTPSEFSRRSIIAAYGVPDDKVTVVPNGVSSAFRPMQTEAASRWVRERYAISSPFILTVGDLQPRKNHIGLIQAFEDTVRAHPDLPHLLVIVGKETWYAPHVRRAAQKSSVTDRIHFTGWIADDDLRRFYCAAELFVFPSLYEGFGLPILEAMACGRATLCSNTSAMPEVANTAGILFNPYSVWEIARAMQDVLLNSELRARMEGLGLKRAASFNWNNAAQQTLNVYSQVVERVRGMEPRPVVRRHNTIPEFDRAKTISDSMG